MVKDNNTSISICILRLSSIGDVTHIIPIISTIRDVYPKSRISWVIGKTEHELVKNLKNINFIVVDKKKTLDSILEMRNLFKNNQFDVVFHMQKSLRSKLIANIINGRVNVTFNDIETRGSHVIDHFFSFLEKINIKKRVIDWQCENILCNNDQFIKNNNLYNLQPFITINPYTSVRSNNYREWSYDNFATISDYCRNQYSLNTVILGKTNQEKIKKIKDCFGENSKAVSLINKTSLSEMLSVINLSKLYIGPDSGTLHMARMINKPIIGLYATSNPKRTGPYQKLEHVIDKYSEALDKYSSKKKSSVKWGERVRDPNAMNLITIDDVKAKIKEIIKN